jgi:anti-sigma B factor antagonist
VRGPSSPESLSQKAQLAAMDTLGGSMAANAIPTPELKLSTEQKPEETVIRGTGKITAATTNLLQNTVRGLIPSNKRIVLDLTEVEYVDSSGLGALVSVYMAANHANCVLEIANPKQRIRDLFKITKLASIFDVTGDNYFGVY